jgi:hypothetical protein
LRARLRAAGWAPAGARVSRWAWNDTEIADNEIPPQVRVLYGRWPLVGRCSFCSRTIGTAIVLIVTPDRFSATCNRCDYADNIAERLSEIAARDGFLRTVTLSAGGLT